MGKRQEERDHVHGDAMPPAQQLAFTAAGAIGAALLGATLARRGWRPQNVSAGMTALGALVAAGSDNAALRAIGAGAMSGSGAQLVLTLFAHHLDEAPTAGERGEPRKEPANANAPTRIAQVGAS